MDKSVDCSVAPPPHPAPARLTVFCTVDLNPFWGWINPLLRGLHPYDIANWKFTISDSDMTLALKVQDSEPVHAGINNDSPKGRVDEPRCLVSEYGARMSAKDVAVELGYSYSYFTKKIGYAKYRHLDWVKVLLPARIKNGAAFDYRTSAVECLMKMRGLI